MGGGPIQNGIAFLERKASGTVTVRGGQGESGEYVCMYLSIVIKAHPCSFSSSLSILGLSSSLNPPQGSSALFCLTFWAFCPLGSS